MIDRRFSLLGVLHGLMCAENLGDVHDELDHLCDVLGIQRLEGNYVDGWTPDDWYRVSGKR